ncbi:MAG: hypothetical protein ACK5MQ_06365 [Pikeienuella sp.]
MKILSTLAGALLSGAMTAPVQADCALTPIDRLVGRLAGMNVATDNAILIGLELRDTDRTAGDRRGWEFSHPPDACRWRAAEPP